MATPDPVPLPQPMPEDLKARGWKMARVDGGMFKAKNDTLGLYSNPASSPEEAIAAARQLDQGATMSYDGNQTTFAPETLEGETLQPLVETIEEQPEKLPPATNSLVPVTKIRLDGGTQPRDQIDQSVVDRYAEDYQNNAVFPLIVIFHDGIYHWLADGFHRYFAFRKAFPESGFITADVRPGTQRDAVLYSLGANATHGLPRSNADKRRAVLTLLEDPEWSMWSDNVIAQKAGVSQPFVSSLRRDLSQNVLSDRPVGEEQPEEAQHLERADLSPRPADRPGQTEPTVAPPAKRIGADGVARDTRRIGRRPSEKITGGQTDILAEPRDEERVELRADSTIPALWPEEAVRVNILVRAGKSKSRGITISGAVGDGAKPIFLSEYSLADLDPPSPALLALLAKLKKTAARKPAARAFQSKTKARKK